MRNVHIVLLTKTVLNWIKFNSSKQNSNFSKYIPRERGGHPISCCTISPLQRYSPRTRGLPSVCRLDRKHICIFPANAGVFPASNPYLAIPFNIPRERGGQPTVACPGAGMRTFPCVSRDAPFSQILGISPSDYPLRWQGCSDAHLIQTIYCILNSPYAGLILRNRCRFRRITPFLCFRRVGSSVRKKDAQLERDLPCIGRGLSIGNKYTNSPRIDGVEPKTKTASTEELPCASGGSKVVCICHSNLCICGEKSTKAR